MRCQSSKRGRLTALQQTPLPGTWDRSQEELAGLQNAQRRLQALLWSYGYGEVEVPVLERTDLYLRKLGSQLASLMFTLTDQYGERLCLRPEFTGSVIRSYIHQTADLALPLRWQYCGPVFRDGPGQRRQFTQLGAELIGSGTPGAEAELLALACQGLTLMGAPSPRLLLGHAGLIPSLFKSIGLSERSRLYLMGHLDLFKEGDAGLEQLRTGLGELQLTPPDGMPLPNVSSPAADDTLGLLQWFLQVGANRPTGRRSSQEIIGRFRMKHQSLDNPADLERALQLGVAVSRVRATPSAALQEMESILNRFELECPVLQELRSVLTNLEAFQLDGVAIEVDFGLSRSLGYYTGIIFELYADGGRAVGGGGRYDDLIPALGGPSDVPALGFAYTVENLLAACGPQVMISSAPRATLVVPETASDFPEAVRQADRLRAEGEVVVMEVEPRTEAERQAYCKQAGIVHVMLVTAAGVKE